MTSNDGRTVTVSVPVRLRRRPGRKVIIGPAGDTGWVARRPEIDSTLVKLVARAHRWKRLLEGGRYATITELAAAEKISRSYLCRVLRLSLLAPDIVEAILGGTHPGDLSTEMLLRGFPDPWGEQLRTLQSAG